MGYIVRKISRAKWEPKEELGVDAISADAVTADLRTTGNCLSFWECSDPNDKSKLDEIALALATNPESDRVDKIDLAWIEKDAVLAEGIALEKSEGNTIIPHLRDKHIEAVRLDLEKISILAKLFARSVRERSYHRRFTMARVKKILCEAIDRGELPIDKLPEKVSELCCTDRSQ